MVGGLGSATAVSSPGSSEIISGNILNQVEGIKRWSPPSLPRPIAGPSLAAIGSIIYVCGGRYDESDNGISSICYNFDTSDETAKWNNGPTLPMKIRQPKAVAMNTHLWFFFNKTVIDHNTVNGISHTYSLPFKVNGYSCAVSNNTHCYVFTDKDSKVSFWVNSEPQSPEAWTKVKELPDNVLAKPPFVTWNTTDANAKRSKLTCYLFRNKIYVNERDSYVTSIDTADHSFEPSSRLKTPRLYHQMMVFDGQLAVVGGISKNGKILNTIETLNLTTNAWAKRSRRLQTSRADFGAVTLQL